MSRLSGSIHTLRAGLVEAINAAGLPPCIVAFGRNDYACR